MKKVLILYENAGGGHVRMANIIKDMLQTQQDVQVLMDTPSRLFQDSTIRFVITCWNWMITHDWIALADLILNYIIRSLVAPVAEAFSMPYYIQQLDKINPDMIIYTYDGFGKVLGVYAKRKKIPFIMVPIEPSPFHDLVSVYASHLVSVEETKNAVQSFDLSAPNFKCELSCEKTNLIESVMYVLKCWKYFCWNMKEKSFRGLDKVLPQRNSLHCSVVGPIAPRRFFEDNYARLSKSQRKARLGIKNDKPCILVVSGSLGGKFVTAVSKLILHSAFAQPVTIVAVCAKDLQSLKHLQAEPNTSSTGNNSHFTWICLKL